MNEYKVIIFRKWEGEKEYVFNRIVCCKADDANRALQNAERNVQYDSNYRERIQDIVKL